MHCPRNARPLKSLDPLHANRTRINPGGVPVRDGADAVTGTWIEFTIRRKAADGSGWQQTYYNTFFTSLEVTAANVAAIARAGRARWKVEKCAIAHFSTNVNFAEM